MLTWNNMLSKTTSHLMYRVFMPWATLDVWRSAVLCPYLADGTHHLDEIMMPPLYASWCSGAKCQGSLVLWIYSPCIRIQDVLMKYTKGLLACTLSWVCNMNFFGDTYFTVFVGTIRFPIIPISRALCSPLEPPLTFLAECFLLDGRGCCCRCLEYCPLDKKCDRS